MVARCLTHVLPDLWHRESIPDRAGWERVTCSKCGALIGENPIKAQKIKQNDDVVATGGYNEQSFGGLFEGD